MKLSSVRTYAGPALLILLIYFASCNTNKLAQTTIPKPGMIKVEILYPNSEGKTFDMDYYQNKHMPMVAGFLGNVLKFYEIDKGLVGRTPDDKAPYLAVGYFYINGLAEYNKIIAQHRDEITIDFKNYTNVQPIILISEIKVVKHGSS